MGGSQGAHSINMAVIAALPLLSAYREQLYFVHQTGKRDEFMVRSVYKRYAISNYINFFFNNIGEEYGLAHLVIGRAGGGICSELTAIGRAAVLVPYPYAASNHQTLNAKVIVSAGGAILIPEFDLNGYMLAKIIINMIERPDYCLRMETASRVLNRPWATIEIAEVCLSFLREED